MTVTVSGYLILISIDFYDLFLHFLVILVSIREDISNNQESVWPHKFFHFEVNENIALHVVFSTLFSVFGNVVKHGL